MPKPHMTDEIYLPIDTKYSWSTALKHAIEGDRLEKTLKKIFPEFPFFIAKSNDVELSSVVMTIPENARIWAIRQAFENTIRELVHGNLVRR